MKDETTGLLEAILKAIVTKPDEVRVTQTINKMGVLLSVKIGDGDAKFVIGKHGRNIRAIKTIMAAVGAKNRARVNVNLEVPRTATNQNATYFYPAKYK